jgi:two-component system response regulator PilR (NtrC family)
MSQKAWAQVTAVSEAVLNQFNNYAFPGNVRELRNTLERAVIVCDTGMVETKHCLQVSDRPRCAPSPTIQTPSAWE